jgi:hypothetical protein
MNDTEIQASASLVFPSRQAGKFKRCVTGRVSNSGLIYAATGDLEPLLLQLSAGILFRPEQVVHLSLFS